MFRFTIPDLLWLMVVVGLGFAWWVDREKIRVEKVAAEKDARDFWSSLIPPKRADEIMRKYGLDHSETR